MTSTVHARLADLLGSRQSRRIAIATTIRRDGLDGNLIVLRYHATDLVFAAPDCVVLAAGRYRTATTKRRINSALPAGWHLYQHRHEWFLRAPSGDVQPFADGIVAHEAATAA
jgi:hypothetical protein